jgi:hypothetical protein
VIFGDLGDIADHVNRRIAVLKNDLLEFGQLSDEIQEAAVRGAQAMRQSDPSLA